MPDTFTLRPMTPADGEAVRHLMENDPDTGGMQITTKFQVDPVTAWRTLKPDMVGAVAVEGEDVLGTATVSFENIQYNGRVLPSAFLENLKVHHTARGKGVATALAQWRVEQARGRFGDDGVILTGTSTDNIASQNTMKKWANQFYSPLTLAIRPTLAKAPAVPAGLAARAADPRDYEQIMIRANRFYFDYQLYPPTSPELLQSTMESAPEVYAYHVVRDTSGALAAGALVCVRAALMHDEVRNVPPLLQFMNDRVLHLIPSNGMLKMLEVSYVWYDRLDAARYLWKHLRWAYRDRADSVSSIFDPRSRLKDVFQVRRWHVPKITLLVALHGPEMMDTTKLVCGTLRG